MGNTVPLWKVLLLAILVTALQVQAHTELNHVIKQLGDPFRDIRSEHLVINYLTKNTHGRTTSKGYGFHYGFGKVHVPVNPIQFIDFTKKLATSVKNSWMLAHPSLKTDRETGIPGGLPMSAGLLVFRGEHSAEFSFLTQSRPRDVLDFKKEGTSLLHQSNVNQAQKKHPIAYTKATAGIEMAKDDLKILKSWYAEEHQLGKSNPLCQDILRCVRRNKELIMTTIGLLSGHLIEIELYFQDLLVETQHCTKGSCVECKQLMKMGAMGKQDQLKGAWLISFGEDKHGEWGPQPACTGRDFEFGCQDLLRDNGVLDMASIASQYRNEASQQETKDFFSTVIAPRSLIGLKSLPATRRPHPGVAQSSSRKQPKLKRRIPAKNPFGHISLEHFDTSRAPSQHNEFPAPSRPHGYFYAIGQVASPVRKREFVEFTKHLSSQARSFWTNKQPPNKPNANFPHSSTGLLVGSPRPDKNLVFYFWSQPQVNAVYQPTLQGQHLVADTHMKQIQLVCPQEWTRAQSIRNNADTAKMSDLARKAVLDKEAFDLRNSPPYEHKWQKWRLLDAQNTAVARTYWFHATTIAHQEGIMATLAKKTQHVTRTKCADSVALMQMADGGHRASLRGSWQVSYGAHPERFEGEWGPQMACKGKGDQFGCDKIQKEEGVEDLYWLAAAMEHGHVLPSAEDVK